MKKYYFICVLSLLFVNTTFISGQNISINALGTAPDASALLDINVIGMSPKGLLIPRVSLTSTTDATTIGTPATSLLVYNLGTSGLSPAGYFYNSGTPGSPIWVQLLNGGSPGTAWHLSGNAGTTAGANFIGTTDAKDLVIKTNNTEWMRILSGGNVGIGTTSPLAMLHVFGSAVLGNGIADGPRLIWRGGPGGNLEYRARVFTNGTLGFFPVEATLPGFVGEVLNLTQGGFVGIGTLTPTQKLAVEGNIRLTNDLNYNASGTERTAMRDDGQPQLYLVPWPGQYDRVIIGNNSPVDLTVSGKVGVGMWPGGSYRMEINGNIAANDLFIGACGQWLSAYTCSDSRYKKDISPIKNVLPDLMKLQGVKYNWRKDEFPDLHFDDRRNIGFIAQEVEKIFPEVVNTNKEGYKSIEYAKLTAVLTEAIQEQQKIIEEMQKKIEKLEKK